MCLLILSLGCSKSAVPPELPQPTAVAVPEGRFVSPPCEGREYPREVTLGADGRFTALDLISPCPEGVACVWSGIVERRGAFVVSGQTLTFTVEGEPTTMGKAFPEGLRLPELEEIGAPGCTYEAMPK